MKPEDDPLTDIYGMMDKAGLTGANLMNSKKPFAKIVNEVRTALANNMRSYVVRYGHQQYHLGVLKGKEKDDTRTS